MVAGTEENSMLVVSFPMFNLLVVAFHFSLSFLRGERGVEELPLAYASSLLAIY